MSLLEKLRAESLEVERPVDAWLAPLQRVRGKIEFDGQERVSSQTVLDVLEVAQRSRTAGTYRRLAKLMAELGWTAVRVRDLTRGGYKEQVRGYVPDAPDMPVCFGRKRSGFHVPCNGYPPTAPGPEDLRSVLVV
jgi:hypothetical protein